MEFKVGAKEDGTSSSSFIDKALSTGLLSNPPSVRRISDTVTVSGKSDQSEALTMREIEKRKIREEIIMSELLRRRELEAEVMREMLLEGEISLRRAEELSLIDSPVSLLRSGSLRSQFFNHRDGLGIEGKSAVLGCSESGFKGILSMVKHPDGGVLGELPFQAQPGVKKGVEIKPVIDHRKGQPFSRQPGVKNGKPVIDLSKGKAISVKPMNSGVAGIKRKFETGFTTGDDESLSVSLIKKSLKDWSCPLCQVKTTCEQGLKDHLKGKKHRAREKALRRSTKTLGKSISNSDPLAEETENPIDYAMCTGSTNPHLSNCPKENEGSPVGETTAMLESTDFKFWCTLCKFGTTSEASMTAHRMGKNHMTLLQENGGGVIEIKTMPDDVQCVHKTKDTTAREGKDEERADEEEKENGEKAGEEEKENGAEFGIISPSKKMKTFC